MRRPAIWLFAASIILLVTSALLLSYSFAQEQESTGFSSPEILESPSISWDQEGSIQDDILSTWQELTQVDTGEEMASWLVVSDQVILSLSGDITSSTGINLSWNNGTGTQSGDILIPPQTGQIIIPQIIISEVFYDGSDERIELTNLGSVPFSGMLVFTGIGMNTSLFVAIASWESLVIGKSGRTFSYILDTSVIKYFASMGFTDTKEIKIFLSRSGQFLDSFIADTGIVVHYNDKKTSLEKVWSDGTYIITWTSVDRQLNVSSDYLANPGSFEIKILDFSPGTGEVASGNSGAGYSGSMPIDCQLLPSAPPLSISEIFWGNDQLDFFIEILALQDFSGSDFVLSGSFLAAPLTVSLASFWNSLQQGRRILISSGQSWANQQLLTLDNQALSASESGGWLAIFAGSGQSGQVMDIVTISSKIVGSSLYFGWNHSECMRKLDTRGRFSPWFDEYFLRYFAGTTWYKIVCERPTTITSPIVQITGNVTSGTTISGNVVTGTISSWASGSLIPDYMRKSVHIDYIDYNPPGSDTNNEKITFVAPLLSGDIDFSQWRYLMIGTRKRYLRGTLSSQNALTLQASFSFPNSTKESSVIVQLWNQETLVDSYSYVPQEEAKPLTGKDELSGNLLSGNEFLFTWEAKILWIIPNPKGADTHEQIALKVQSSEFRVQSGGNFLSGFSLSINGKKKKIKDSLPMGEETILSWSLGLVNKAACVSLLFQDQTLDTLCYPQPKEGETIYADGKEDFVLNPQEQVVISDVALKTIGNTMCAFYGNMQIDCNNIPSGKTALKTKNENKLYESFIKVLQPYLQQSWAEVFYSSDVHSYFTLLWASKKDISAGQNQISTSHGDVPVYDISAQLHVIETYSPAYRAKKFGQVLLNEI